MSETAKAPAYELVVPAVQGGEVNMPVAVGTPLFVVGPNGSGKSGLIQHVYRRYSERAVRISAHRSNTLQWNVVPFSPADKVTNEINSRGQDVQPTGRYLEWSSEMRNGLILADLIEADNAISRSVREAMQSGDVDRAKMLAGQLPPLGQISELLQQSGIPVSLEIAEGGAVLARKRGSEPYTISALSDGERAALLTAGKVLTAKPGSLILVDEPERHLHASITVPLLTRLFELRHDCAFIITTHELSLPAAFPAARTALIRDSRATADGVTSWDLDILEADAEISDDLKRTILGARRTIIFTEGTSESLDRRLYELIFPQVSVEPRETSAEVRKHVEGVRGSGNLHWLQAFGVVDQDQLSPQAKVDLQRAGVFALSVYSVEALYYHPYIQSIIAERQVAIIGGDPGAILARAADVLIDAFAGELDRMAARMTEQAVKDALYLLLPDWKGVARGGELNLNIDIGAMLAAEKQRAQTLVEGRDVAGIVARYPIREIGALKSIAQSFGFKDKSTYEAAVRKLVAESARVRNELRAFFGELPAALNLAAEQEGERGN